jgi:drug/metabolite transporter (DMT)-like permease
MSWPERHIGLILGIVGMVAFAGTLPARRLAVAAFDPLYLCAVGGVLAGGAALLVLALTRQRLPPRALWSEFCIAGFCSVIAFPVLTTLAMTSVPAAHGGVVLGIQPLAIAAGATLLARERPSAGFWLVGAIGTGIVVWFVLRRGGGDIGAGDVLLLFSVLAGGANYTLYGRLTASMPGWEAISWSVAIYLPLAIVAMLALWPRELASTPYPAWAALGYVGLVSQYTAYFLFNAAMALAGIARMGQLLLLLPFVTVALAWQVNGERIEVETLMFATAVVATVAVGQRMQVKRA